MKKVDKAELRRFRELVDEKAFRAQMGERESALWLMKMYCASLSGGHFPVRELLVYFHKAFVDVLEYEREGRLTAKVIEDALNLCRPGHRERTKTSRETRNRDMLIAALVLDATEDGSSALQAKVKTAKRVSKWSEPWLRNGVGGKDGDCSRYVRSAWQRYGAEVRLLRRAGRVDWLAEIRSWEYLRYPPATEVFGVETDDGNNKVRGRLSAGPLNLKTDK